MWKTSASLTTKKEILIHKIDFYSQKKKKKVKPFNLSCVKKRGSIINVYRLMIIKETRFIGSLFAVFHIKFISLIYPVFSLEVALSYSSQTDNCYVSLCLLYFYGSKKNSRYARIFSRRRRKVYVCNIYYQVNYKVQDQG